MTMATKKKVAAAPKAAVKGKPQKPVAVEQIIAQASAEKKRVLHIGCGTPNPDKLHQNFRGPNWQEVRMDIDPSVAPDIIADMTNMDMVKDNEFDAIWSSHNIEHLYYHQVPVAFAEFFRVIKPGGFFLVTLPDIQTVAAYVAEGQLEHKLYDSPAGPITPLDIVFGFTAAIARGNHFMAHRTAFTAQTLAVKLHQAGFCNIQVIRKGYDLWGVAYKLPKGHPMRKDSAVIGNDKDVPPLLPKRTAASVAPVANQVPPAGASAGVLPDELNRPPLAWQPLGLKK